MRASAPALSPRLPSFPAIAAVIAVEVGFDPIMLVLIGEAGLMAGRMTPITPEAAIITKAAADAGIDNVMGTVLLCQTLVTMIYSVIMWVIFKGYKVKTPLNPIEKNSLRVFQLIPPGKPPPPGPPLGPPRRDCRRRNHPRRAPPKSPPGMAKEKALSSFSV